MVVLQVSVKSEAETILVLFCIGSGWTEDLLRL